MIHVTKTFLPDQEEYQDILKQAWDLSWLTNRGVLVQNLEAKLKSYLKVPNVIATTNGTLPIQIAIKSLELKGEIITTPFSYVATVSAIVWEGCEPVFVDIEPNFLTIDPLKIEAAITPKTVAILATHVFGNPCDVEAIDILAKKYNLKVIYDAAHCFGVDYKGQSVFNYGDVSTCSFHATKIFHTGEGGALFTKNQTLYDSLFYHHNFGHNGPENFKGLGINAKMSELQAAMGLAVFPYMERIINSRKRIVEMYDEKLKHLDLQFLEIRKGTQWNFSYYPIIFSDEAKLVAAKKVLEDNNIFSRRYFYPSLNTLDYVHGNECPISESIAKSIMCLPLFYDLAEEDVFRICDILKEQLT